MKAGTPPEPGKSRITISTYRLTRNGRPMDRSMELAYEGGNPDPVPDSLTWPPCRCPRCRDRTLR